MKFKDRVNAFMGKNISDESAGQKSASGFSPFVSQALFGGGASGGYISPSGAMMLWEMSDPIYNAVDLIATPFSQMTYSLKDKKTGEYLSSPTDHPFLELLENPGPLMDSGQLMYSLMVSFLVAGAGYPKAIGNVKYEPSELRQVYANKVNLVPDENNYLYLMTFSDGEDSNAYVRQILPKRKTAVYQSESGLAETIQITKAKRRTGIMPSPPLSRLIYQIYSKYYGNMHNSNILENGSRPSGLWSPDGPLSQDAYEAFADEVRNSFSGPQNAGKNVISPRPMNYTNLMLNPKDMDFMQLLDASKEDIYNLYHIPLALVSPKTMTMSNFDKSQTALYDQAVLPNAYLVLKRLGEFLLPRYKDGDRFELSFDEKTLPALRARMMETAKTMREVKAFEDNEIRNVAGYDDLEDGDRVWKSTTDIPADSEEDEDDPTLPMDDEIEDEEE